MSKDIWHTADDAPKSYVYTAFYVDDCLYFGYYEPQHNQYGIFGADKVEKWCYVKDLSSYIPALETELDRTRKELEQSEICCTEWEKQALDYKAENIALSGDLERTRKALEIIKKEMSNEMMPDFAVISDALKTALEQKEVK